MISNHWPRGSIVRATMSCGEQWNRPSELPVPTLCGLTDFNKLFGYAEIMHASASRWVRCHSHFSVYIQCSMQRIYPCYSYLTASIHASTALRVLHMKSTLNATDRWILAKGKPPLDTIESILLMWLWGSYLRARDDYYLQQRRREGRDKWENWRISGNFQTIFN